MSVTEACQQIHALVDGELEPEQAHRVRLHLAHCVVCQQELTRLLQLKALTQGPLAGQTPSSGPLTGASARPRRFLPRWSLRSKQAGMVVLVAAVASTAFLVLPLRASSPRAELLWLTGEAARPIELRLSYAGADSYRPYDTLRSAGTTAEAPVPLGEMARLEERGDLHGIAAAYLLRGKADEARAWLSRAGGSPDVEAELAVVELMRGDMVAALDRLNGVLLRDSRHPQALWNRGIALERLGLPLAAAQALEAVTALGEPGWADEARQRAQALRSRVTRESEDWEAARKAGEALAAGKALPHLEHVSRHPGFFRLHFYDALRTASTVEQVKALGPLAEALDARQGGSTLRDAVRAAETRDYASRAPLSEDYARLLRRETPTGGVAAFLDRLRRAKEQDLLLGTLLLGGQLGEHLEEYRALATATRDPWFLLLAEHEHAKILLARRAPLEAEQRLLAGLKQCGATPVAYRCALIERELAMLYRRLHRPAEATRHAHASWQWARTDGAWFTERAILLELGQIARLRKQGALARAYLDEAVTREPDNCELRHFVFSNSALAHMAALEVDAARRDLDEALRCPGHLTASGAQVLADLARLRPAPEDARRLSEALAGLRGKGKLGPGELALLTHIEGRFLVERERAAGEALLRRAITEAEQLPQWNVDARKARAYSYTSLLLAAGRAGEYEQAYRLLAEELGGALPGRCVLGAAVDDERTLVVARDAEGRLHGHYDASRTRPLEGVEALVPHELLASLRACEQVSVVARPPLHGRVGLLPPDVAWSYILPRPEMGAARTGAERRLVVADVEPPPGLALAPLAPWTSAAPGDTLLTGAMATPGRVLEAMTSATQVEIHAHGLINLDVSDASLLVLSPEADGRYALTAADLRERRLQGAPLVILAACRAAHTAPSYHEPFSLPVAFLTAGARAVLAATVDVPDAQAGPFFEAVQRRIRAGQPVARALRDERVAWLQKSGSDWVKAVLAFE
jgi:hypothetical protein